MSGHQESGVGRALPLFAEGIPDFSGKSFGLSPSLVVGKGLVVLSSPLLLFIIEAESDGEDI